MNYRLSVPTNYHCSENITTKNGHARNLKMWDKFTVEIHKLDLWVLDWTTTVAGETYRELTGVSFTCLSNGPI